MSVDESSTTGRVTIVTIDRPEVRNAVDGPTAALLADAFRAVRRRRRRTTSRCSPARAARSAPAPT